MEATGNRWLILQSVSLARLQELSQEPTFMAELVKLQAPCERYMCRESCSQVRMRVLKKGRHFGMDFGASARRCQYTAADLGSGLRLKDRR